MSAVDLWKARASAATSDPCDRGSLCTGLCVSRKWSGSKRRRRAQCDFLSSRFHKFSPAYWNDFHNAPWRRSCDV